MMWREFFLFEIKYRLKHLSTYIFGLLLFGFGFLIVNILGGGFSGFSVVVMSGGERLFLNSAFINSQFMDKISIFLTFIIAAFIGGMLSRDFENKAYTIMFTKPISKWSYISARFSANIIIVAVLNLMLLLGMFIAYFMPWIESDYFMAPKLLHYLTPLTHLIIPNIILISSLLLSVFLLTKKSAYLYVTSFFILTVYLVGSSYVGNIANRILASLIDPFGLSALSETTRLWSIVERNTNHLPMSGLFLANRILWLSFSILLLVGCVMKFNLKWIYNDRNKTKKEKKRKHLSCERRIVPLLSHGLCSQIKQYFSLLRFNLKLIFRSLPVYLLTLFGIAFMVLIVIQHGTIYNTRTLPVTYNVAEALSFSISLLLIVFITIYTGELVWKSKDHNYSQIIDTTPVKNIAFYLSQISSLILLQLLLFSVFIIVGLAYQTLRGYTEYEIMTYIKILIGLNLPQYIIAAVLCFFIHTLVTNKYTGHFVFILTYLLLPFLEHVGLHHRLLQFNSPPRVIYSDMNAMGNNLSSYIWFTVYWSLFALLIAFFTGMLWKRGHLRLSWHGLRNSLRYNHNFLFPALFLLMFTATGSYIFYNTNVINNYVSPKQAEKLAVAFEQRYGQYGNLAQPKITDVKLYVDIYPDTRDIYYRGNYTLQNKTEEPISQIHISVPKGMATDRLSLTKDHRLIEKDETFGYHIFELDESIMPEETIGLDFEVSLITRGFSLQENFFLNRNGTFIHSTYFPAIGYNDRNEISSPRIRRRYNLPEKERFRNIDDPSGLARNYISQDADWITYEAVISTSDDQTALTSGDLIDSWSEGDRSFFHYKLDGIMVNYYAILSAAYTVQRDKWNGIDIEIYYDSKHSYNINQMMKGVKKSLAYLEDALGPYPHNVLRIAEFPRYGSFAQSLATLIPFSESIGFIADIREGKVNYPFAVTAHEVAHQWWAHQVIGANVKGALTLAESLTQYFALMIMKQEFRREVFRDQLRYDLTRYLSGRSSENREENPVYLDDGQQYIHYSKGPLVLHGLSQYIGEEVLNSSLRRYFSDKRYQQPPYTTSLEMLEYITVSDSLQYLWEDSFKKITLYENGIRNATKTKNDDGTYTVNAEISAKKYYSDGLGNIERTDLEDWIELVVYDRIFAGGRTINRPIHREFILFTEEDTEFNITVESDPVMIAIDPDYLLIDMMPYSNMYQLN